MVPTTTFMPFFAPLRIDSMRELVPGNSQPFPNEIPAAPASIMAQSYNVPCRNMARKDSQKSPCWMKNIWNAPTMTPLVNKINPVAKLVNSPNEKQVKDTRMLFNVMPKNMGSSAEVLYTAIGVPLEMFSNVMSTYSLPNTIPMPPMPLMPSTTAMLPQPISMGLRVLRNMSNKIKKGDAL